MGQALVSIQSVTFSRNPVNTGEQFIVSVEVFAFEAEKQQRKMPFKLGKRKEVR